jgi:hypothetical protein
VDRRKTSAFWSPRQPRPVPPPLPHDLRESEDLVPLVGDRNGCRSGIIVSRDPNAVIFRFVVDPRTESSGDANLVGHGSRNHVLMRSVWKKWRRRDLLRTKERVLFPVGCLCLGFCLTRDGLKSRTT